ncbi:hypothetical protein BDW22DRAFT_709990 [Trametopsis cervina]|nr:hypothetical protein BDW22DRAFT_709990 [Trametopsis cervina]
MSSEETIGQATTTNRTTVDQLVSLERSPDVWFADGNCVLQAENVLFKVYTGVLSKQSAFFASLFSLPQPADTQETYDNCPLIPLIGHTAKDATYFLKAMFDLQFFADVRKIKDVDVVVGVANMSLAYEVDLLLRRSIAAFTALYPATLSKWQERENRRQYPAFTQAYGRALPFVTVQVAKKTGMEVLLPSALLECCSYSIAEILDGVATPSGEVYHLDRDSQRSVLQARTALSHSARAAKTGLVQSIAKVDRPSRLRAADLRYWEEMYAWVSEDNGPDNWVDPFQSLSTWPSGAHTILVGSSSSTTSERFDMRAQRGEAWKSLPASFGLASWDHLRRVLIH